MSAAGLSVVVPAYDEAEHLEANLERLVACLAASGRPFEVILVDDGSRDETAAVARAVAAREPRVRVLTHARNLGKGRALGTGAGAAREPILVLLDADLEIPPEDVLPLVARLERAGADLAVGSKYHPQASLHWPWSRRALSRVYHLVTALLFRLPLRDTQTGLKAIRREVALAIIPRLRCRRFAWDVEFLLLAHRAGHTFVTGPVHVRPAARASRVGWGGALQAGIDTLRVFLRDRTLAAYGGGRTRPPRSTRVLVSGDDLGLCGSVGEGLLRGLEAGGLTSVSVLIDGPAAAQALGALPRRAPDADVGLHLDLLAGRSALAFAARALLGHPRAAAVGEAVRAQVARLRAAGFPPTHLDAHRHAYLMPWVYRRVCAAAAREGVGAIRSLRPLGPPFVAGFVDGLKRLVLLAAATASAGVARAHGLTQSDGHVDALDAARWLGAGCLPRYAIGRTVEVVAHPAVGSSDLPRHEAGTLDRAAQTRAVLEPPLATSLAGLGADPIDFGSLARRTARVPHAEEVTWRSQSCSARSAS